MNRCPQLRRLPKAPRISSLHFRRQTPGSVAASSYRNPHPTKRLDPEHPINLISEQKTAFIRSKNDAFTLGALPMGLLTKPDPQPRFNDPFDTWAARVARGAEAGIVAPMILNDPRHNRLSMSLQISSSRGTRTHQRVQINRRFKTALTLITVRGADAKKVKGRLQLVFDESKITEDMILQGWTYFLQPTLELFRMPYPKLVSLLRPMLREIWTKGTEMEAKWAEVTIGSPNRNLTSRRSRAPKPPTGDSPAENATQNTRLGLRTLPRSQRIAKAQQTLDTVSLPPEPVFNPFPDNTPSDHAPDRFPSLARSSTSKPRSKSNPPPKVDLHMKASKNPDWWAIGSRIEAGVAAGTRWDPPETKTLSPSSVVADTGVAALPRKEPEVVQEAKGGAVQSRLAGMLFRGGGGVVRPDSRERAAGQLARRMHQFEEK